MKRERPTVAVGIMYEPTIEFELLGEYRIGGEKGNGAEGDKRVEGVESLFVEHDELFWRDSFHKSITLYPTTDECSFILKGVTIGIGFHWERKEEQRFKGALKFIVQEGKATAINLIDVEEYLTSVISSEMSATASLELLKAHAIISRSWLLAQIERGEAAENKQKGGVSTMIDNEKELVRWWDGEDHVGFDICADDHCQRYQGVTRVTTERVVEAIEETAGMLLTYEGEICDARYSKSCGGAFEEFQNCWGEEQHPYLVAKRDWVEGTALPNLKEEESAKEWILSSPEAFCNSSEKAVLEQVLNSYDQETVNFYRWVVTYSESELSDIVANNSSFEFGTIVDLIPLERGSSGRIVRLKIVGDKGSRIVGKELEIRRILSTSHLYSSAFIVERGVDEKSGEKTFTLRGAGWGHGVGLCQIGAAVMGEKGYDYRSILLHYFVGATIEKRY